MKRRLTIYFLFAALLSLCGASIPAILQIRSSIPQRHAESFAKLAEEVYYNIRRTLQGAQGDILLVAGNPLLRDETSDAAALKGELAGIRRILSIYEDISIIAPDGAVIASTDYAFLGDWRHKRHFNEALGGRTAVSNVMVSSEPSRQYIEFTAPIMNGSRVLAVVAMRLNMDRIADIATHLTIGETGHAFVIDEGGIVIIHRDPSRLLGSAPDGILNTADDRGIYFTERGAPYFGSSFTPNGAENGIPRWRVVVAQEEREVQQVFHDALLRMILLAAAVFVVILLVALGLARRITRPLHELTGAIERIREDDLAVTVAVRSDDELGRLAAAFNRMVGELRESRKQLQTSQKRYRDIAELMPQALFEVDLTGRYTYVNRAGLELFGYTEQDLAEGRLITEMLVPEDRERVMQNALRLMQGAPTTGNEYTALRRSGETFPIIVYSALRYENEQIAGLRGVAMDLTTIKKAEEELRRKDLQLIQAQKMELIGTLAGGLAHDFNNVLGGIGASTSLLLYLLRNDPENTSPERLIEYLSLIESQVKRAGDMIRQLLTLSRRQEIVFVPMDLARAALNAVNICENTFEKSVRIELALPDGDIAMNGDAALIEQVLINLMVNARHAMTIMRLPGEPTGGLCTIAIQPLSVDARFPDWPPDLPTGDFWQVQVIDTGVGIAPENLSRIFDPFYSTKEKGRGTGLGLPMAFNIVRQHQGHITVDSTPGKGSTFTLYLPASKKREEIIPDTKTPAPIPSGSGAVLLADDEPLIRETTAAMLAMMGYEVIAAGDGEEAIMLFNRHRDRIVLLLFDLLMPKLSGVEALRDIRRNVPEIPAIIMSGYRFDEKMKEVDSWGNLTTLQKPFGFDQLALAVRERTER